MSTTRTTTAADSTVVEPGRERPRGTGAVVTWWVGFALVAACLVLVVRAQADGEDSSTLASSGRHVTTEVAYATNPPTSGDHHPVWWDCGRYAEPIPAEHALHSLEHGAVWITYRPDIGAPAVAALRQLAARDYLLLSPLPQQFSPITLTAWSAQVELGADDVDAVEEFIVEHRLNPNAPESGGLCTNGTTRDLVQRP